MNDSKNKYIVSVYLKGGHSIDVECEDWNFTKNHDGTFNGYSFTGMKKGEQITLSIPDIVAVKTQLS
ncbi:hypothetical protein [Lysinibacillus sp. BPa_S21]|uniref:hypothetical protein n=1 Tax=Lysinibacillus sp. BPa_S21 TaxID=2932478 RepID=UPI002012EBC2|nr:hypothetical protein [Lysinibacillus sp. BPa_S21]MCL1696382.1 hypothetical protein [Lysinibacillus sp. BPa_S21]